MGLLADVRARFAAELPFAGRTIGVSLHTEPKTAVLLETLAAGGARIVGTGNHGSTQDDVVAALAARGIDIFGARADSLDDHRRHLQRTLDAAPDMLLDNGADLALLAAERGLTDGIIGGTEETTSGGMRLREEADRVPFPVLVINDSPLKAIAENRHGVGQSTVESLQRITNLQIPGRRCVVVGYGWCGRGIAQYLRSLGAKVAVVEADALKALEAAYDGYRVDALDALADWAEVIITATGRPGVVPATILDRVADGTVLGNVGHFPWELDVAGMRERATSVTTIGAAEEAMERLELPDGRHIVLLADGRMFNLAGVHPRGNSIETMDLGFMLQALSLERVALRADSLPAGAQAIPDDIERTIALAVLERMQASR